MAHVRIFEKTLDSTDEKQFTMTDLGGSFLALEVTNTHATAECEMRTESGVAGEPIGAGESGKIDGAGAIVEQPLFFVPDVAPLTLRFKVVHA